jgi:integrase
MQTPDVLEAGELRLLFDQLSQRERVMVLLDAVTGLRRSELMALKLLDVDFEQLELAVMFCLRNSLKLRGTDRILHDVSHAFFRLLDL